MIKAFSERSVFDVVKRINEYAANNHLVVLNIAMSKGNWVDAIVTFGVKK